MINVSGKYPFLWLKYDIDCRFLLSKLLQYVDRNCIFVLLCIFLDYTNRIAVNYDVKITM